MKNLIQRYNVGDKVKARNDIKFESDVNDMLEKYGAEYEFEVLSVDDSSFDGDDPVSPCLNHCVTYELMDKDGYLLDLMLFDCELQ